MPHFYDAHCTNAVPSERIRLKRCELCGISVKNNLQRNHKVTIKAKVMG